MEILTEYKLAVSAEAALEARIVEREFDEEEMGCALRTKEMRCRWIGQCCIISLVEKRCAEMRCRWIGQCCIISSAPQR